MEMKEMVYRPYEVDENDVIKSELLYSNIYRKIPYVIISYGNHPCAYIVNPYLIGKGKWKEIKTFRATFDYINKVINPQINQFTVEDYIQEEEEENDSKKTA
mgnify:CR=1 FL=1